MKTPLLFNGATGEISYRFADDLKQKFHNVSEPKLWNFVVRPIPKGFHRDLKNYWEFPYNEKPFIKPLSQRTFTVTVYRFVYNGR